MHAKGALGMLAAAAVSVVVAAAVAFTGGNATVDPRAGKPVLPQVAPHLADIGKVVLKRAGNTITFVLQDKTWTVAEKDGYPADATKLRPMLLGLAQISFVEPKTAQVDLYKRLNLEDPSQDKAQSTAVEIFDAKGGTLGSVIAGKRRIDELGGGNDGVYIRLPNEPRTWLARGTLDLDGDISQWLDRRIADIAQARIRTAVLQQPDGTRLTISRDKPEDKFTLKELPQGRKLKSDTGLVEPATVLQGFDLTDVKAAKNMTLPQDGAVTADYSTFDGLTIHATVAKSGDQDWMRLSAEATGDDKAKAEAATLTERWSPWVYGIASYKATAIRTKLDDLLEAPAPEKSASAPGGSPQSQPKAK
jgi:hypothetical protein